MCINGRCNRFLSSKGTGKKKKEGGGGGGGEGGGGGGSTAIYTGHAPVRGHLHTMDLFDGDPIYRFCGMETETVLHIICCCKVLACQHYNVGGRLIVESKDIHTASVRDLCLFI